MLSTDAVVHELQSDPVHISALVERFGPSVESGGHLDRSALATAAFAEDEGRQWLEEYMWPLVGARIGEWIASLDDRSPLPRAAVVEVPLLFESGMDAAFDASICVLAKEDARAQRAAARGHAAVDERAARQLTQKEKSDRATWIVENDGSEADLEMALSEVVAEMVG